MGSALPDSAAREWGAYWPLVTTALFGMILATTLSSSLGVMIAPIEKEFGWSRAEISMGPILISVTGLLLATVAGYAIDRLGARVVGIMVVIGMTGSLAMLAATNSNIWSWWLPWALFGIASSATSTVWLAPVSSLFAKGRGFAVAVTLTGSSLGSGIVQPVCQYFVSQGQWRMGYLVIAGTLAVILIPLTLMFWRGAEHYAASGTTGASKGATDLLPGMTPREGFASFEFWQMFAAFGIALTALVSILLNLVPMMVFKGLSANEAAAIAGSSGLTAILGRFVGGWAVDHIGLKWLTVVPTLCAISLPLGLIFGQGSGAIIGTALLFSTFVGGVKYPALIALVSRHFGPKSFGTLYGTITIAASIAVGVGPLVASYVYDVTRSYTPVFWAVIPALFVAALLYGSLGRPQDFELPTQTPGEDIGDLVRAEAELRRATAS